MDEGCRTWINEVGTVSFFGCAARRGQRVVTLVTADLPHKTTDLASAYVLRRAKIVEALLASEQRSFAALRASARDVAIIQAWDSVYI